MIILLVDDEPSYRILAGNALSDEGFQVLLAKDGEEGLRTLEKEKIDLVISDLHLPVMDGLAFCKAARERPGSRSIPFLFVSAFDDEGTPAMMASFKNCGFLRKAQPIEEMFDWIRRLTAPQNVEELALPEEGSLDPQPQSQSDPPAGPGREKSGGVRVLVVDDEESLRFMLTDMLSKEGYVVTTAADGAEAIEKLGAGQFDVMLLDLIMPNVSGFGVLKHLKEHPNPVKIIVVTAYSELRLAVETKQHGAHDFIAKPFMRADLLSTIEKVLHG